MDLIKELGLEKCKAIVDGAPENSQVVIPCLDGIMYFAKRDDGKWFRFSDGYQKWLEYWGKADPMDLAIRISDLRTAIANHEKCQHEWNETTSNGDAYRFFVCKHCDSTRNYVPFKDDNPSHFDHCSDIKNHISPNTKVIER